MQTIVLAQSTSDEEMGAQQGINYSLVPVLGFSEDTGLFGGVLLQRFNYGEFKRPFLTNIRYRFTFSTMGDLISTLDYEHTELFSTDWRILATVDYIKLTESNYFGIGNNTTFSEDLFDEEFFFHRLETIRLALQGRKQVAGFGRYGILDVLVNTELLSVNGSSTDPNSRFAEEQPFGSDTRRSHKIGIGLIADSRDSEFYPTQGVRYEAQVQKSAKVIGSEFNYGSYRIDLRHFFSPFGTAVLAQQLLINHTNGDVPYWELPTISDDYGLRGYHLNRFIGDTSIRSILEARTWLFSFMDEQIRTGGQLFWDSGRVFSNFDSNRLFDNWKHTYGFGGALSLFNPDFIFRGDIGFSDESTRLYIGIGYVF